MSRFSDCLKFVLKWEGGYVNDDADSGGATNKGVTQGVYDEYRVSKGLNRMLVVSISDTEVEDIYRRKYWARIRGDSLPKRMDMVVFDAAVNMGVVQASKFLQRALGVPDDGMIGPHTTDAAIHDEMCGLTSKVVEDMLEQRRDFYQNLVAKKPTQRKFLNGWLNRVNALEGEVK